MTGDVNDEYVPFSLSAQTLGSDVLVTATGEVDLACAPAVSALIAEVITGASRRRVVIDGSRITFIDAGGLAALLGGAVRQVEICFRSPSRPVQRLLELTGMCDLIEQRLVTVGDDRRTDALLQHTARDSN